ncbi:predicted protein, partial [Naegleria gruberi]
MGNIVHHKGHEIHAAQQQVQTIVEPGDEVIVKERIVQVHSSFQTDDSPLVTTPPLKERCWNRLMAIPNFFSHHECEDLIKRCKNFKEIQDEYPKEYRNSTRELIIDADLASLIFDKLKTRIDLDAISKMVTPFGVDSAGTWKACGVNEMMRFNKYQIGEYFKIHTDGQFKRNNNERSIYTLLIYLNDDFKGGETRFYNDPEMMDGNNYSYYNLVHTVKP